MVPVKNIAPEKGSHGSTSLRTIKSSHEIWTRLHAAVHENPDASFFIFAVIHLAVWTLVPTILCRDLPLDVIEGIAYGQEFQFGYWKHPPLPWWILGILHRAAGSHLWPYFLLGQIAVAACLWTVWRLGCAILSRAEAFVAIVLLDGYVALNIQSMDVNHNLIQLPLFGAIGWLLYCALLQGRLRDWVLLGMCFSLAFYTKYTAAALLVPVLLFTVLDAEARRCWRTAGPYVAMLLSAVMVAPHAAWLIASNFSPIGYAGERAAPVHGALEQVRASLAFGIDAVLFIVLVFVLFIALQGTVWSRPKPAVPSERFVRNYIATLALGPLCFSMAASLILGLSFRSGWATQFWCFISLFFMLLWRPVLHQAALRRLSIAWSTMTAGLVGVQIASQVYLVATGAHLTTQFPGDQFAATVTNIWREETGLPLEYVVGEFWLTGNVILFSSDRPSMYASANRHFSPWINETDVFRRGAMLLWMSRVGKNEVPEAPEMPEALRARFPTVQSRQSLILRVSTPVGERVWRIGWALLRPHASGPVASGPTG